MTELGFLAKALWFLVVIMATVRPTGPAAGWAHPAKGLVCNQGLGDGEVDRNLLKSREMGDLQRGSPSPVVLGTISSLSLCHGKVKSMPL